MTEVSLYTNSIFEQPWWLEAVAPGRWKELLIKEEGEPIARWAYCVKGKNVFMPPQTQTLGFWLKPDLYVADSCFNRRKKLITELIDLLPKGNVILSLDSVNEYFLPFIWKGFTINPRVSYQFNDLSDLDMIYNGFSKVVKKNIKTARNKVSIREVNDITLLYGLMEKTFSLQKRRYPYSLNLFERIYDACKKHNACKLLYAMDKEGKVYSGALFVYDERNCYYLIAGTDPRYRSSGANSLVLWEGIQFAATVSKKFDFEGSMIEGIENFVRQFGATPTIYYQVKRLKLIMFIKEMLKPAIKRMLKYK
ncbi:MAG: GNAT family N-acetyltransferase [Odoribacter splanchnicus]|nr:GNAT family N-acetyltransferase [Odoribacter splanchnicus]